MTTVSRSPMAFQSARWVVLSGLVLVSICGCATGPNVHPNDPLEPFNRGVFGFNDAVDKAIFKPVATIYRDVTPTLVRAGVRNFLGNLDDAWSFVNSALQAKVRNAADNFMRFGVNTVMGLGGILDVASEMGIERHREDFGQTLGRWGISTGPYLVLPLLGPSTLRDALVIPVDMYGDIVSHVSDIPVRNSIKLVDRLETRAGLLSVTTTLDEAALDKYSFTRDVFLQRRSNAVFDGDSPGEDARGKPSTR